MGIIFEKSRLDFAEILLLLFSYHHIPAKGLKLCNNRRKIVLNIERRVFFQQRKIHIFAIAAQAMENTQACTTVESRFFKESTALQSGKCYLLHDFIYGVSFRCRI